MVKSMPSICTPSMSVYLGLAICAFGASIFTLLPATVPCVMDNAPEAACLAAVNQSFAAIVVASMVMLPLHARLVISTCSVPPTSARCVVSTPRSTDSADMVPAEPCRVKPVVLVLGTASGVPKPGGGG